MKFVEFTFVESILVASRNMEKCEKLAEEIRKETNNPKIECMECNLASFESIQNFVAKIRERNETINVLINNAGNILKIVVYI
jgi:short-subunit dehydrogenase